MFQNLANKVQLLAHLATITIAILLAIAVGQNYFLAKQTRYSEPAPFVPLHVGAKLPIPGIDWAANERTLLIALSPGCYFCSASGPFYQRLMKELSGQKNTAVVAVFPQPVNEARNYLNTLGVSIGDVRQAPLQALGVIGTPTLVLVNKQGAVTNFWRGQLPSNKEEEVLSLLKCGAGQQCS